MKRIILSLGFMQFVLIAHCTVIDVPLDETTIQSAINNASNGDTVLVAPGIYYENLNFGNKNLVLTSHFYSNHEKEYIENTIINGSNPRSIDTSSCIIIAGHQDSTTLVQGFTITAGKGTLWPDTEFGGIYREGGAILIDSASPVIAHNLIIDNIIDNASGANNLGGGAIRSHRGNPLIRNNFITGNYANYGGAITLFFSGGTISNNIIAWNNAGKAYGGGIIWVSQQSPLPVLIINNTLAGNISQTGGVLYVNLTNAQLYNNIIIGNIYNGEGQLNVSSNIHAQFNDIQDGYTGESNFDEYPMFDTAYQLLPSSPCIDRGDSSEVYNDIEDPFVPGFPLYPAQGSLQNDVGAFGGPLAGIIYQVDQSRLGYVSGSLYFGNQNLIGIPVIKSFSFINQSLFKSTIDTITLRQNTNNCRIIYYPADTLLPMQTDSINIEWIPSAVGELKDTMDISYVGSNSKTYKVIINGAVQNPLSTNDIYANMDLSIFPNPANSEISIVNNSKKTNTGYITDLNGAIKMIVKINPEKNVIDISSFDKGVYLICIPLEGSIFKEKLIKL